MPRLRDTRRNKTFVLRDRTSAYRGGNTPATPIEASRELGPCVYFIRTRDNLVKIGYTSKLHTRRHGLDVEWSHVLAVMAGTRAHERACHALYAASLARGREYFHPTDDLLAHINDIRAEWHMPPVEW